MNFKKILSLFVGLNVISLSSLSVLGCRTDERVNLQENNKKLTKKINDLLEKNKKHEQELKVKKEDAKSLQTQISKAKSELQQLNKNLEESQKNFSDLAIDVMDKNKDLENLYKKNEESNNELNLKVDEVKRLQGQKDGLLKDIENNKKELASNKDMLKNIQNQISKEKLHQHQQHEDLLNNIEKRNIDLQTKEQAIEKRNIELKQVNSELLLKVDEVKRLQGQKDGLLKDIENNKKELASNKDILKSIQNQNHTRIQENLNTTVFPIVSNLKETINKIKAEIENLKANNSDFFVSENVRLDKLNVMVPDLKYVADFIDYLTHINTINNKYDRELEQLKQNYDSIVTALANFMFLVKISENLDIVAVNKDEASVRELIEASIINNWNSVKTNAFSKFKKHQLPTFEYYININMNNNDSLSAASFRYYFEKGESKTSDSTKNFNINKNLNPDMTELQEKYENLSQSKYLEIGRK